jgi:hypothetical protein
MPREPVGVLILRVWLEEGSLTPFRAAIRVTADVGFVPSASLYLAEPGEVIDAVREFLERMSGEPSKRK